MSTRIFTGLTTVLLLTAAIPLHAQSGEPLNADKLFATARKTAFDGRHEEARTMLAEILVHHPDYHEVRIFLARTYAWDGLRAKARKALDRVLEKAPDNEGALNALTDVEMWDERYDRALVVVNKGLERYPDSEDFLYKKASILFRLARPEEAAAQLTRLLTINPSHAEGTRLMDDLRASDWKYTIGLSYNFDFFSRTYDPAHYVAAHVARTGRWGTGILRVNYSSRFSTHGIQPEIILYPKISRSIYAYLNYGYSESDLFPDHRFGVEVYTRLPANLEASAGLRCLDFGTDSKATIYTGSIAWYFKDFRLSARPYVASHGAETSFSSEITLRKYFQDRDNYLGFSTGMGFSPDERQLQSANGLSTDGIYMLKSQRAGLEWQETFGAHFIFTANLGMARQELSFEEGNYVWFTSTLVRVRKRF